MKCVQKTIQEWVVKTREINQNSTGKSHVFQTVDKPSWNFWRKSIPVLKLQVLANFRRIGHRKRQTADWRGALFFFFCFLNPPQTEQIRRRSKTDVSSFLGFNADAFSDLAKVKNEPFSDQNQLETCLLVSKSLDEADPGRLVISGIFSRGFCRLNWDGKKWQKKSF